MGSEERQTAWSIRAPLESDVYWGRGALAGFVASLAMALVIAVWDLAVLRDAIAALYFQAGNLVLGVIVHVIHGTLFGLLFAAILSDPGLYHLELHPVKSIVAGVVYGLVLALAGAGLIMPIWLAAVGAETAASVPNVSVPLVAWHLVYGTILGAVYALPAEL